MLTSRNSRTKLANHANLPCLMYRIAISCVRLVGVGEGEVRKAPGASVMIIHTVLI